MPPHHPQDCRTQDQECTCAVLSANCRCGLNGRCLSDGSCHAAECATLGLQECQCVKKVNSQLSRRLYQVRSWSLRRCGKFTSICSRILILAKFTRTITTTPTIPSRNHVSPHTCWRCDLWTYLNEINSWIHTDHICRQIIVKRVHINSKTKSTVYVWDTDHI